MFTDTAKNNMVGAEGTTHLSLHTAFSATGTNEVTGGSPAYARKAVSWNAAASGQRTTTASVVFDVPATTVRFIGRWTAITGGTFLGMSANAGSEFEFYVDVTANTIERVSHGRSNGDKIVFVGGTAPGGLTEGTVYFVVGATADDFQVAATAGGAAIDLTSQAADAVTCSVIIEDVYAGQGTHTVSSLTVGATL